MDGEAPEDPPVLGHVAHAETGDLVGPLPDQLLPVETDASLAGPHEAHDALERGGLSNAVAPEQADQLPLVQGHGDALQDVAFSVIAVDVFYFQHGYPSPR